MESDSFVSIVIGNSLTREGVKRILSDNGFSVIQEVSDPGMLEGETDIANHIVILESGITDDLEIEISDLRERFPISKIVVLDDHFDFQVMYRAFEVGAAGYILMDSSLHSFIAKIRLILMNERIAPSKLIDIVMSSDGISSGSMSPEATDCGDNDGIPADFNLTDRQQDILDRLALGQSNKLISRELMISEATVKVGLRTIFRKLSVKNRTQAALIAREKNLMSPQTSADVIPIRRLDC